jgi:Protein of unknown function (DUF669)
MTDQTFSNDGSIDLSQFDEAFAAAPAVDDEIPDGSYDAAVDRVELTRSQTSGNPMLKWTLRLLDPGYEGRLVWRNNVLASEENVKWLKADLKKCGLALEKLSELPGRLNELLDVKLSIRKKTNGDFTNIYVNRRLRDDELSPAAGTPF